MQHVIVTGGARGLGLAIVKTLLDEGYKVSTCARHSSDALTALQKCTDHLFFIPCDVADAAQVKQFVKAACDWAKDTPLYGLVNNAAMAREGVMATFPNVDSEQLIQTNLLGSLYCCREVLRRLLQQRGGGRIVNISSIVGLQGYTGLGAYAASKAGLDGLTRSLSRECGRRGITVNSVSPGFMETQMSASLSNKKREQIIRRTPLGRLGMAEDVTPMVAFLLSDKARFITGQSIVIDGGISH